MWSSVSDRDLIANHRNALRNRAIAERRLTDAGLNICWKNMIQMRCDYSEISETLEEIEEELQFRGLRVDKGE